MCMLSVTVSRSSSDGDTICYVHPVLWMEPCYVEVTNYRRPYLQTCYGLVVFVVSVGNNLRGS